MDMTKPMIDLIREIRRRSSDEVKGSIKFSNPNLIDELIVLHHKSNDPILIALMKELCALAGVNIEPESANNETEEPKSSSLKFSFENYKKYLGS